MDEFRYPVTVEGRATLLPLLFELGLEEIESAVDDYRIVLEDLEIDTDDLEESIKALTQEQDTLISVVNEALDPNYCLRKVYKRSGCTECPLMAQIVETINDMPDEWMEGALTSDEFEEKEAIKAQRREALEALAMILNGGLR